jgi:hypothetical protein
MQNSKERGPIPLAIRTHKTIHNTTEPSDSPLTRLRRMPSRKVPKDEGN